MGLCFLFVCFRKAELIVGTLQHYGDDYKQEWIKEIYLQHGAWHRVSVQHLKAFEAKYWKQLKCLFAGDQLNKFYYMIYFCNKYFVTVKRIRHSEKDKSIGTENRSVVTRDQGRIASKGRAQGNFLSDGTVQYLNCCGSGYITMCVYPNSLNCRRKVIFTVYNF